LKKAFFAILTALSVAAQSSSDGTIVFKNIGIQNAAGTGTYNVPLFSPGGTGAGNTVTVGLFLSSNLNTPLATGVLGTNAAQSPYIVTPAASQTVFVTDNYLALRPV
jgi:hypothetical protein